MAKFSDVCLTFFTSFKTHIWFAGKSNRRTASRNKPLKNGNKKPIKKEANQRKSTAVNDECETSSDSASR